MKSIFTFSTLFILCLTISAQNNIDLTSLPEVNDYIVTRSNPTADTVIIGLHGGPTDVLYQGDFSFFETTPTFSVIEMQQYQHLHPEILANSAMTLEEAIVYNDTTVAMLRKVVNHFNNMDKTVVLIGHSYGAFHLAEYLDDYGIEDIHKVIPMAGRLNMNQEIVDGFATGKPGEFVDGINTIFAPFQAPDSELASMKLLAGVGYNRFVDSLGMMDLTKLMYVYGTIDQAVGSLLPEELAMLENNNATILAIQNGGHDAPFFPPNIVQVLDFIRSDQQLVSLFNVDVAPAAFKLYPTIVEKEVTIETEKRGYLKINNTSGQVLIEKNCSTGNQRIDMSSLPKGLYVATYQTMNREWAKQKFIVR